MYYDQFAGQLQYMGTYARKWHTTPSEISLTSLDKITPEKILWLSNEWIAAGSLTILAGEPGVGKSTLAYTIAAQTSNICENSFLPDHKGFGHVVIVSTEDNYANSIIPRLESAKADLSKIHKIVKKNDYSVDLLSNVDVQNDLVILDENLTRDTKEGIALIIVDPISAIFDCDVNNEKNIRAGLESLSKLACNLNCAVIGVTHTGKTVKGKEALSRVASAKAITQVPRMVLLVVKNTNKSINGDFVIVKAKSNIADENGGGIIYKIESTNVNFNNTMPLTSSKVERCGMLYGTASEIIEQVEKTHKHDNKFLTAQEFLMQELKHSERLSREIDEAASNQGISLATLVRAKKSLKIKSEKRTGNKTWIFLP